MYIALPEEGRKRFRHSPDRTVHEAGALEEEWQVLGVPLDASPEYYTDALEEAAPGDVLRATEELL